MSEATEAKPKSKNPHFKSLRNYLVFLAIWIVPIIIAAMTPSWVGERFLNS